MPKGMDSWVIPIVADIDTLKKQLKEAQAELDRVADGDHTVKLDLDTKSLDSAMKNLDKMLKSLGKGTGDFKQFEKLSDELKNIKKSLGGIDDKGISNLYNSINSIDKALNSLTEKLQVVKKDTNGNLVNTSQIGELADLFVKIEEHLNSIHKAFGEVGKDKGLTPLINQVNELKEAMSGLKLNLNLDLGNNTSLDKQIESKSVNLLSAYKNLFKQLNMNSSGALNQQINEFLNGFDNNKSVAEQNALYANFLKQIRNQAKASNINGKDYVKDWAGKEYWSAVSGAKASITKAEKSASSVNDELKSIFGDSETDLTGVISQLETIANKLDTIASSAKTMGEAFSSGLNVSASLEEVTKLTERVKELENELQKVKFVGGTGTDKTYLSSETILPSDSDFNNILKNLNRTKSELKEIVEITKQVNYDKDGHRRESYTLKDKYGSTEIYGKSSKTDDGNIIKKNIKDSSLKEAQAAQKAAEAQAKAETKRQEQLAKAKAAALSKSRQAAKAETQSSVDNAAKQQLSAWKEIQKIRLQMSKTTDTGELSRLEEMRKVEQERYLAATKILNVNRELYNYESQSYKLQKASKDTTNAIATNQAKEQAKAAETQAKAIRDQKSAIDSMVSSSDRLVKGFSQKSNVFPSDKYKETVQKAADALEEMKAIQDKISKEQNGVATDKQIEDLEKYKKEINDCSEAIKKMTTSEKGSTDLKATKEIEKIEDALRKNIRMSSEAKAQLNGYITELRNNPAANVEEIATAWKKVVIAEKEAGRGGKSLFSAVGEKMFYGLAGQIANMVSLYDVINVGKQAVNQVIELDTALVDLQKTTTMSSSQLNQFYYDANDVAKQMCVTTQEIIEQASAWSRLGYSSAEAATQMAQLSSQFASISPGMETSDAQEGLVSIMKAWNIGVDDVKSEIMDKINILGRCMPKHVVIHGAVAIAA